MKVAILLSSAALAVLCAGVAGAQQRQVVLVGEKTYLEQRIPAPARAFELTVATGYTQGFGNLRSSVGMPSVAGAGIGVEIGAGYRMDPRWAFMIAGQYQELSAERATGARGFTSTLAAQYHLAPSSRIDPWVELGAGYRFLWETSPTPFPDRLSIGFELARVRAGLDMRVAPELALSPVVGLDATIFMWQDVATSSFINDPTVSAFVFAGLQGRIDIGGRAVGRATTTSATPAATR